MTPELNPPQPQNGSKEAAKIGYVAEVPQAPKPLSESELWGIETQAAADKAFVLAHAEDVWMGGLSFDPTKKVFSGPINKPRECKELGRGQSEVEAWANAAAFLKEDPDDL